MAELGLQQPAKVMTPPQPDQSGVVMVITEASVVAGPYRGLEAQIPVELATLPPSGNALATCQAWKGEPEGPASDRVEANTSGGTGPSLSLLKATAPLCLVDLGPFNETGSENERLSAAVDAANSRPVSEMWS